MAVCRCCPWQPKVAHVNHNLSRPSPFFKNGAKSGFEMCFAPSTFGAGGPNQNTSRIQYKEVTLGHFMYRAAEAQAHAT